MRYEIGYTRGEAHHTTTTEPDCTLSQVVALVHDLREQGCVYVSFGKLIPQQREDAE